MPHVTEHDIEVSVNPYDRESSLGKNYSKTDRRTHKRIVPNTFLDVSMVVQSTFQIRSYFKLDFCTMPILP